MRLSLLPFVAGTVLLLAAFTALGGQESPRAAARKAVSRPQTHSVRLEREDGFGRLLSMSLDSSPFPDRSREDGYFYEGEYFSSEEHYSDPSVDVFVPKGFEPKGRVDLVFFFHGWYSSIPEATRDFELIRQFSESGTKALLVMPELARDAPDSFGGKLESADGFDNFVKELLDALRENRLIAGTGLGKITLVGHSGAYRVIARILGQAGAATKVREVCLFDGLYENVESFQDWISSGKGQFLSFYALEGDPADNSRDLAASLRESGIRVEFADDDPSADPQILGHRVVFVSSPYEHGSLINQADEFKRVLAAGVSRR